MPRTSRADLGGYCYHVLNRGNAKQPVFLNRGDYWAFVRLLGQASERIEMRLVAWCLMPNHFHLVLWPHRDGDLGRWMQWLLTAHVRRHHKYYGGDGHVWQGRFKAFPIEQDEHLLAVLRYVERNPLRANLVSRTESWLWSSASLKQGPGWPDLSVGPVPRGEGWIDCVNQPQSEVELAALRRSVERGSPYGGDAWQKQTAESLGLEFTLKPRGRPRKA